MHVLPLKQHFQTLVKGRGMSKKLYDIVERTDALGTSTWIRWKDAQSALKLQELVIKEIEDTKYRIEHFIPEWEVSSYTIPILQGRLMTLQYLLEQSQKTVKEKGSGGKL